MSDETLVLVPGLLCTRALFGAQIAALAPARRIIVADHTRDDAMAAIAGRLLAGAPDRFALVGLSMGGYVALETMRQAPGRVTRLALLDTTARPDTAETRERRLGQIAAAQSGRLAAVLDELWPRLVHPGRHGDAALLEVVRAMMQDTGAEGFVRQSRAILGRPDSRPQLERIRCPTLVLVGDGDVITPPEVAQEIADAIAGARLSVLPGVGHASSIEAPEQVTRELVQFLSS